VRAQPADPPLVPTLQLAAQPEALRLLLSPPGFHLCTRNVHRVLLATTVISAKLLDDECYNNQYWASVGGVSLAHLNQLEVEFMSLLNFEVLVTAPMIEGARARLLAGSQS
jgi:hypothetical protein